MHCLRFTPFGFLKAGGFLLRLQSISCGKSTPGGALFLLTFTASKWEERWSGVTIRSRTPSKRQTDCPLRYEARNNHYLAHIIQAVHVRFLRCDVMIALADCYITRTDDLRPRVYHLIFRRIILPFDGFHVHHMGFLSTVIERSSTYLPYIHLIDLVEIAAILFVM